MAHPLNKLKHQGKMTVNNQQQVNVVAKEEEIEVKQKLSSILLFLKVNHKPIPIFESKFVVMDDTFHMIRFKKVQCNTL